MNSKYGAHSARLQSLAERLVSKMCVVTVSARYAAVSVLDRASVVLSIRLAFSLNSSLLFTEENF